MKRYITAGAGSGKTYTMTTEVARRIKANELRPEQVIMTTFTKAAAQELREKAKKELVKIGLLQEAQQMEHALIGTVHSVANTFLTKYWYLLGIMPDACVLEEDEMKEYRDMSLRGLLDKKDRRFLFDYCEKYKITIRNVSGLHYSFWKEDLCKVLDYMQWYGITDELLDKSLNKTTESIIKLLEPQTNNTPTREDIKSLLTETLTGVQKARQSTKKDQQLQFLGAVSIDNPTDDDIKTWLDILKGREIETDLATAFASWGTQKLFLRENTAKDHREYARIIFGLAKKWREEYRKFKDEHHLIDFNDMEEMFLKLLSIDEVQKDIQSRYKCIYVDEFQDSNPMQVNIFQKLSELIDTCYVGDSKQAIYKFRGSDTELTTAVADSIKERSTLGHSYRSVEPLVNLSNTIFEKVFEGQENIKLTMPEDETKGNRDKVDKPMRLWTWNNDLELALRIQQLILREKLDCSDVAVLGRNNDVLDKLAGPLRALGIPVCRESNNIKETRTGQLLKALLTLMITPGNALARAEVAYLTEPGFNLTHLIEDRLEHLADKNLSKQDYLNDLPIIGRLNALRGHIKSQSISALTESLIIELDLYRLVRSWDNANTEEANLQMLVDLAQKYEESATQQARPATVAGFIDYFTNHEQASAADNSGVRLYTYHKAKGLEWKVVILLSLDYDAGQSDKLAKRCILGCHCHRQELPTPENTNPEMTISLVRNIYTTSNESMPSIITSQLQKHPYWEQVRQAELSESARLLYVGVTRARNMLILASNSKKGINLNWFQSVGLKDVQNTLGEDSEQDVLGIGINFFIEKDMPEEPLEWPKEENRKAINIASEFPEMNHDRDLSPSLAGTSAHELGLILNDNEMRIPENVPEKLYARMGDFIHQVFCRMDDGIGTDEIVALRDSYGLTAKNLPEPNRLQQAWDFLIQHLEKHYGSSVKRIHELPFRHIDNEGRWVSGYMDFVWETADGYVVVDYKTCAAQYNLVFKSDSEHYAGRHGDQLDCYQRALEAEGSKTVKARLIYYPMTGFLVEVK